MAFHHLESACRHEGFDFRSRECQGPGELTSTALWIVFFEMAVMAVSLFLPYFNAMWVERDPSSISSFLGLPFGLPLIVTRSGAMQIFLILIFAINCPMIVAMFSDQPCETGLGGCFTISCVCANYIWQGYVFMFFVLALGSYSFYRALANQMYPQSLAEVIDGTVPKKVAFMKSLALICVFTPAMTGIFSFNYTTDLNDPYDLQHNINLVLHAFPMLIGTPLLIVIVFAWFFARQVGESGLRAGLCHRGVWVRVLAFLLVIISLVGMAWSLFINPLNPRRGEDDMSNFCHTIRDADTCDQWPTSLQPVTAPPPMPPTAPRENHNFVPLPQLPIDRKGLLDPGGRLDIMYSLGNGNDEMLGLDLQLLNQLLGFNALPGYTCKWIETPLTARQLFYSGREWMAEQPTGRCIKHKCELIAHSKIIAWEYCFLWAMFVYVAAFAIPDAIFLSRPRGVSPRESTRKTVDLSP